MRPEDFIIARKRKKYKFALFKNTKNCFELKDWRPIKTKRNIIVEIGAGTALFLVELAIRNPEQIFIALDVKADRLQKGARLAKEKKLDNIFFVRARASQLLEVVEPYSVNDIWLTFSDPFPKKKDAKHRLTNITFLEIYKDAHVRKNARLFIKTDDKIFFEWSIAQLRAGNWRLSQLSNNLHKSNLPDNYRIMTSYEKKWTDMGLAIYFLEASW